MVLKISGANYQFQGKQSCLVFFFFVKVIFTIVFFAEQLSAKRVGEEVETHKKNGCFVDVSPFPRNVFSGEPAVRFQGVYAFCMADL